MIVSGYLSKKLKFFSLLLCLLVVIIHSYKEEILLQENIYNRFFAIYRFISIGIGNIVIPLFFTISALLFFKNFKSFSFSTYSEEVTKRFHSLFIPYIIVSALGIAIVYSISKTGVNNILSFGKELTDYSIGNLLIVWLIKPETYHLWFIRNLFILSIFSPVLFYFLNRKKGVIYFAILFTVWLLFSGILPSATKSIVFFSLGALISIKNIQIERFYNKKFILTSTVLWMVFIYLSLYGKVKLPETLSDLLSNISIICGIVSSWGLYDLINKKYIDKIVNLSFAKYSFFIYLFHEPMLTFFIELSHYIKDSTGVNAVTYIAAPITTIILCTVIGSILKKHAPRVYNTITGGR